MPKACLTHESKQSDHPGLQSGRFSGTFCSPQVDVERCGRKWQSKKGQWACCDKQRNGMGNLQHLATVGLLKGSVTCNNRHKLLTGDKYPALLLRSKLFQTTLGPRKPAMHRRITVEVGVAYRCFWHFCFSGLGFTRRWPLLSFSHPWDPSEQPRRADGQHLTSDKHRKIPKR